jgi:hypothetical protein
VLSRAVAWGLLESNPAKRGVPNQLRRSKEKQPFEPWQQLDAIAERLSPGDVGAYVTDAMGRQAPDGLLGIHTNLLVTTTSAPGPTKTDEERAAAEQVKTFRTTGFAYFLEQATRPQRRRLWVRNVMKGAFSVAGSACQRRATVRRPVSYVACWS